MGPELEPKHVPLFWFAGGPALDRVDGADRRPSKQTGIRVLHRRVRQPFFGRCRMQMLRYSLLGPLRKNGITIDNSPEAGGPGPHKYLASSTVTGLQIRYTHCNQPTMDPQKSLGLLAKAQESLALFQSTGTETARIDAHEKALQLARSLERPRDAVLKLSFSV